MVYRITLQLENSKLVQYGTNAIYHLPHFMPYEPDGQFTNYTIHECIETAIAGADRYRETNDPDAPVVIEWAKSPIGPWFTVMPTENIVNNLDQLSAI